ncbi:MAG: TIGR03936 family radical SAM-associated protein [Oscillospiraceae bacterium]|nr:TIGR03936 family radical SAM-associated protein [Oscillospiraceae bacterium]
MLKLRMRFEKTGRAVYISHLDLMHTLQRVFLRAGYRLKYSEGFNPHPVVSIAVPLSVGCASVCEIMDFSLLDEEVDFQKLREDLNRSMPEGITVTEIYVPERKASAIRWMKVTGIFEYDNKDAAALVPALTDFYARPEIPVNRRTKRGEGVIDIVPHVRDLSVSADAEGVRLTATVSVNEPSINPELLAAALRQNAPELAPDFAKFTRLEVYDETMEIFR